MFKWKDEEIKTNGDIMNAMLKIKTKKEAAEFLAAYHTVTEHAAANIGYLTGYLDEKDCNRLLKLFDVSHPIFGRKYPTPEEAFEFGRNHARER